MCILNLNECRLYIHLFAGDVSLIVIGWVVSQCLVRRKNARWNNKFKSHPALHRVNTTPISISTGVFCIHMVHKRRYLLETRSYDIPLSGVSNSSLVASRVRATRFINSVKDEAGNRISLRHTCEMMSTFHIEWFLPPCFIGATTKGFNIYYG